MAHYLKVHSRNFTEDSSDEEKEAKTPGIVREDSLRNCRTAYYQRYHDHFHGSSDSEDEEEENKPFKLTQKVQTMGQYLKRKLSGVKGHKGSGESSPLLNEDTMVATYESRGSTERENLKGRRIESGESNQVSYSSNAPSSAAAEVVFQVRDEGFQSQSVSVLDGPKKARLLRNFSSPSRSPLLRAGNSVPSLLHQAAAPAEDAGVSDEEPDQFSSYSLPSRRSSYRAGTSVSDSGVLGNSSFFSPLDLVDQHHGTYFYERQVSFLLKNKVGRLGGRRKASPSVEPQGEGSSGEETFGQGVSANADGSVADSRRPPFPHAPGPQAVSPETERVTEAAILDNRVFEDEEEEKPTSPSKTRLTKRKYRPVVRSGGFSLGAILLFACAILISASAGLVILVWWHVFDS